MQPSVRDVELTMTCRGVVCERTLCVWQLMLNSRDWSQKFKRAIQTSYDEGNTWKELRYDATLTEPKPQGCQGSIVAVPPKYVSPMNKHNTWALMCPKAHLRPTLIPFSVLVVCAAGQASTMVCSSSAIPLRSNASC